MELPKIKVADFEGPFDLLLHLIKKNKMDIYNVEIYKVTNQYLEYLNTRKVMDLEITSEFIVVAATLIEIKSKNLLPKVKVEEEENEEDIEIKLMERLIEYKRFKAVSEFFNDKYVSSGEVFSKKPEVIEEIKPEKVDNDDIFKNITLLDLYNIYNKILENYREKQNKVNVVQKKIYVDKYKVEDKMEELLKKINSVEVIERIMQSANDLAGERFSPDTPVTGLSGGQSRALMIADTAILSASPIVLIDEIENAGIDREKALRLLVSEDKIVLMATHDPLLALMADHRIVIKNGGIHEVLETTEEEKELLKRLTKMDAAIQEIRQSLRRGNILTSAQLL